MEVRRRVWGWLAAAGAAAVLGVAGAAVSGVFAQSGEMIVRAEVPLQEDQELKKGDDIDVIVNVENANNIASFQFELKFDADVLEVRDPNLPENNARRGEFLGSSGRQVACDELKFDAGVVRYTCVTLGPTPRGPVGNGQLATILLRAKGSGKTDVTLEDVVINEAVEGTPELPLSVQSTTVTVKGDGGLNWLIWAPIIIVAVVIVVAAAGFAAMRLRSGSGRAAPAM